MSGAFNAACIQLSSAREPEPNIAAAGELIRRARDAGATLIMTPEVSDMMEPKRPLRLEKARNEADHPMLAAFRDLARETGAWLLLGSAVVRRDDGDDRLANRSFLIAPDGAIAAALRQDPHVRCRARRRRELSRVERVPAGRGGGAGDAALGRARHDRVLRSALSRSSIARLAQAGADFLSIPSAFTVPTGRAHWHVLMRARAIENGCFVFAPAQWGEHAEGRKTYGHSLIVAPWGEILAEAEDGVGFITAEIDPAKIAEARRAVPSLKHDRAFAAPAGKSGALAAE